MLGRPPIIVLACLCLAGLAGCGSNDEGTIPSADSDELISLLDGIEDNVAGGNCEIAQQQAEEFVAAVGELPAAVDDEVKQGLTQASTRLADLSNDPDQCEETTGESGFDELEPTTAPTTTETPTTTTETTETETDEEEPPPEEDDGGDGGPGGGGGGGGGGPGAGGPGGGGGTGEGTVTIEPPSEDDPTSGGIGGEKGPRR